MDSGEVDTAVSKRLCLVRKTATSCTSVNYFKRLFLSLKMRTLGWNGHTTLDWNALKWTLRNYVFAMWIIFSCFKIVRFYHCISGTVIPVNEFAYVALSLSEVNPFFFCQVKSLSIQGILSKTSPFQDSLIDLFSKIQKRISKRRWSETQSFHVRKHIYHQVSDLCVLTVLITSVKMNPKSQLMNSSCTGQYRVLGQFPLFQLFLVQLMS